MSASVGGFGLLSLSTPLLLWSDNVHARSEFRSFLFALVILVVVLILAYLTNPSETSFRAYLTEQSFRQHLSRLDDPSDDVSDPDPGLPRTRPNATLPFHFASRASVSLRTPKHVFHSFGICTIATTRGNGSAHHHNSSASVDQDGSVVSDSWFIGAFGRWWRGGLVEFWYHHAMIHSKDAEGWSSGILGFKALDKLDYNRFPFASASAGTLPSSIPRIAPKLRNRERSTSRLLARRSSTPPPLPKSASLPLHADHQHRQPDVHSRAHTPTPQAVPVASTITATPTPHPSQDSAQISPQIAEVLRQISNTQTSIAELRGQLTEVRDAAAQSHSALQAEVEVLREEKKTDDVRRAKGKAEAKALEEAKRGAEGTKKEAEKKLKRAERVREDARRRIEELEKEMGRLSANAQEDRDAVEKGKEEVDEKEREVMEELEEKKKEVKVAEDVVAALNARAKELEDRIAEGQERLRLARERAEAAKNDLSTNSSHAFSRRSSSENDANFHHHGSAIDEISPWSSTFNPFDVTDDVLSSPGRSVADSSTSPILSRSPRPARLSLGALSNFSSKPFPDNDGSAEFRSKGYAIFDDDIASLSHRPSHSVPSLLCAPQISPTNGLTSSSTYPSMSDNCESSAALIPSSLISVLDSALETPGVACLPFYQQQQNQSDLHVHTLVPSDSAGSTFSTSPVSLSAASFSGPSPPSTELDTPSPFDARMAFESMGIPYRTNSDPTQASSGSEDAAVAPATSAPRRWFSTSAREKEKPKKGLNPDAKVFHFSRRVGKPQTGAAVNGNGNVIANVTMHGGSVSFDALNPSTVAAASSGTGHTLANLFAAHHGHSHSHSLSHTSSSLLRAFAPSRAERRALGGLTHTSLERLPSLSDVGSIPSSPVPPPPVLSSAAAAAALAGTGKVRGLIGDESRVASGFGNGHGHGLSDSLSLGGLPAWLAAPPIIRKLKFSPFSDEDEDSEGSGSASASVSAGGDKEV
ncbi:hypothetical protein CONPUDRAFT_164244 [Coniophora puteana RWD-64-598 SS2]|uniref:Proteophosphoglycan ppg4 n=1 Tax=Coniophora puteana (strain RWD-64-598) TaxID=741705 RepID=A0A5M3MVT5_CONPW|nr:uncharacterized protein CONPUDRAFT_164244 [Coniophora puteana RWD-64-598 SS2]EIW83272.1 hypothetical protein CONPUDRAFT_164244 [Coniophora puteana RWD-64-598 SS2]